MIQHVNVKIYASPAQEAPAPHTSRDRQGAVASDSERIVTTAVPVFQRWIRESVCDELLIDVADYRHVPAGPGVVLVGHEANYSLDTGGHRLGLLYNRKAPLEGGAEENIAQALRAALAACRRLEKEPEFEGALRFGRDLEIIINDRALAPNTDEAFASLKPTIEGALRAVYGAAGFDIERLGDARQRLRIGVHARPGG